MKLCPLQILSFLRAGSISSPFLPRAFHLGGEMYVDSMNEIRHTLLSESVPVCGWLLAA